MVEYGTGSPAENRGWWSVRGVTASVQFNDARIAHRISLSTKGLPKAKFYYYVITVRANGTVQQVSGKMTLPVRID